MFYMDSEMGISNYFVLWCLLNQEVNACRKSSAWSVSFCPYVQKQIGFFKCVMVLKYYI